MDAAVEKLSRQVLWQVQAEAKKKEVEPAERLIRALQAARVTEPSEEVLLQEMHKTKNALLHQKTLVSILTMLTPILTEIVEEGNAKGIFRCQYPEQSMQILLLAALTLLDDGIFQMEKTQASRVMQALIVALEKILGVGEGMFLSKMTMYFTNQPSPDKQG